MRAAARALAGVLALGLGVAGCGSGSHPGPRPHAVASPAAAAPASPSASPRGLQATVLRLADLPPGFIVRPLNGRNLPSQLTGCHRLQTLLAVGTGPHEQVEFYMIPFGPWIDEAVISQPGGAPPSSLMGELAGVLASCHSVTVTEEGRRVRLALAPAKAPAATGQALAYRATGRYAGIPLSMDIVLAPAGRLILLVTNTSVTGPADPAVTAQAVRAAVQRAARA
jgi:hypothetical protein